MSHGRFKNPVSASLAGVKDFFRTQTLKGRFTDSLRIDGKTCLVTGSNRGLGFSIARELVKRGGHVIMACRSGIPEAGEKLKSEFNTKHVEMVRVDLSDCNSIYSFCKELEARKIKLDIVVLNAGVTPPRSRQAVQGQDEMFMVNYLANFILLQYLLKTGVIPNKTFAKNSSITTPSRVVFISSDSHQSASAIDYAEFGIYNPYGVRKAINNYSYFKLLLNTMATEFSRKLNGNKIDVEMDVVCPGPVNTDIIREAPLLLRMTLRFIFSIFFQAPSKAAKCVAYLCMSDDFKNKTNVYLHMFNIKKMDQKVYDADEGKRLWHETEKVWKRIDAHAKKYL
jgi:NAD(P)-dependent dehydrogenase (short-subunit alcohol dehydrogenase family)